MRSTIALACVLAAVPGPGWAQATRTDWVPVGGTPTKPVPQAPVDPDASPEEIAQDAARDLKDNRFYNRPGATREQYNADWQTCRLIARGSRTPAGVVPYNYNPALVSPMAAAAGGAIGGLIAGAIQEGAQRRANRRSCLLIRGWRLVELPAVETARVAAMTDADRSSYFDTIVGAAAVKGEVTERTSFALAPDPELNLDGPVPGPGAVWLGKKVDPAAPVTLAPNEAAVVLTFRRPDIDSAGRSGRVDMARYDAEHGDLIYKPKGAKKAGDTTTYFLSTASRDRNSPLEVHVVKVTPGDYVLTGTAVGPLLVTTTNCFGAPTFGLRAGEVAYVGDFVPLMKARNSQGQEVNTLAYASHVEDARAVLAAKQPAIAALMKPATLRNGATYACSAITMDRWDLPGIAAAPAASPVTAPLTAGVAAAS